MNVQRLTLKALLAATFLLSLSVAASAQSALVTATAPDSTNPEWVIKAAFSTTTAPDKVKGAFLLHTEEGRIIKLKNFMPDRPGSFVFIANPEVPLMTAVSEKTNDLALQGHYQFQAMIENDKGELGLVAAPVALLNNNLAVNREVKAKAKDADDADVYVSGELNGAHKNKTSFSTEIKLQKYMPVSANWRHTPFFKLNASTDPGADPDKMEAGWKFRYITGRFIGIPGAYFDHSFKLESERDFGNTNLLYDTRFTLLPAAWPKGLTNQKVFINPYVGAELGKNVRSPLKAAEGDGIARLLTGVDVRIVFFLKDEDTPSINWTNSYVRRWPLTDELGFEKNDDGSLKLLTFGKGPRDYVSSKFSYRLSKFLEVFTAYEWGRVPPSYKLVDHRFRLGFAYKYKFGVK